MKLMFKKKYLLALVLSIVCVIFLLISGYYIFHNNSILGIGKESYDKYANIVELCDKQRDGLKLKVNCKSFLETVEKNDGNICFRLSMLNKNSRFSNVEICEKEDFVSWDSNTMVPELKVPVFLNLEYKIPLIGSHILEEISLTLLDDTETFKWLDELRSLGEVVTDVRTNAMEEIRDKGYILGDLGIDMNNRDNGKKIGKINFVQVSIEDIMVEDNYVVMDAILTIDNKDIKTRIRTDHLNYTDTNDFNIRYVSPTSLSTINAIKDSKSVQLFFFYIASDSDVEVTDLRRFCSDPEIDLSQRDICSSVLSLNLTEVKVGIENYINDIVTSYDGNRVVLDKLIFDFVMISE